MSIPGAEIGQTVTLPLNRTVKSAVCKNIPVAGTIKEESREIPVAGEFDLCVVGGSATGLFAAVSAARLGARVALVEAQGCFGGTATSGLVCVWHSDHDTTGERRIIGGLVSETIERLRKRKALDVREERGVPKKYFVFNPSELACELDTLAAENEIRPFLHAYFVAAVKKGDGELEAVIIEDKNGRRAIRARVFIDATGDADVVHRMGLPVRKAEHPQPSTMCALFSGFKTLAATMPGFNMAKAVYSPDNPDAIPPGFMWSEPLPGTADITMLAGTRVADSDLSDADNRTRAEIEGRSQVRKILDTLRRHAGDNSNIILAALPSVIGIRQTRQATCLHRLTGDEVLSGQRFPDAVANGSYRVDLHLNDRTGIIFRYLDGRETTVFSEKPAQEGRWREPSGNDPTFYQVPYRALVPAGSQNVLVAGRCLDTDEIAFGAVRVMVNTAQMGQAAGTAALLALKGNCPVASVDTGALRKTLSNSGAVII